MTREPMELNRDKFRKWLEGHRPRQVVATFVSTSYITPKSERWCCRCPIANFLKATGSADVIVDGHAFSTGDTGGNKMPEWASEFVDKIDCSVDEHPNITASRALKILDGIEQ